MKDTAKTTARCDGEEHEIIFLRDSESVASANEQSSLRSPVPEFPVSRNISLIKDFQPLADNATAALNAAKQLELFLASTSDVVETTVSPVYDYGPKNSGTLAPIIHQQGQHEMPLTTQQMKYSLSSAVPRFERQQRSTSVTTRTISLSQPKTNATEFSNSFDPYASPHRSVAATSLLDISDETTEDELLARRKVPGSAGFLEMEEEPPRTPHVLHRSKPLSQTVSEQQQQYHGTSSSGADAVSPYDPIQTASGLLLTHRRVPPLTNRFELDDETGSTGTSKMHRNNALPSYAYPTQRQGSYPISTSFPPLLRYVRLGVVLSALILLAGTAVILHHSWGGDEIEKEGFDERGVNSIENNNNLISFENTRIELIPFTEEERSGEIPEKIILLPLPEQSFVVNQKHRRLEPLQSDFSPELLVGVPAFSNSGDVGLLDQSQQYHRKHISQLPPLGSALSALKEEFEAWKKRHGKTYHSESEHQKRFQIWSHNHHRTAAKNERHGPCKLTGKTVFGSNHFQDLTADEFQSQYLTGYNLKREPFATGEDPDFPVLGPHITPERHPVVHERILENQRHYPVTASNFQAGCKWYDVSCILQFIFSNYIYGFGSTMEPAYDANSYPTSVDWRDIGAVTAVHSQGSCGACWAITAVETIESACFISKGTLYDLSETEVIVCEDKCEMCAGGWPQDAFDYVINQGGLPLESDIPYNADWLLMVSESVAGNSDELDDDKVKSYQQATCPKGGGGGGHSGEDGATAIQGTNSYTRYGNIKGYGYSTAKCVCYTDGSGCECNKQNEGYAVRNIATYGPAVVCLDASTWQDYTDGIITSESGCSSGFMDVNHCVQAVGYAYMSESEEEARGGSGDKGSNSRSGSGSKDSAQRQGYWIVRNQWSKYWGMKGYVYVAMGENTCGILNDMMQVYS